MIASEYNQIASRNKKLNSNSDYQQLKAKLTSISLWINCGNVSLDEVCTAAKEISEIRSQLFKIEAQIDSSASK